RSPLTTTWPFRHTTRSESAARPGTSTSIVSVPRHSKTSTLGIQSPRLAWSARSNSTRRPMRRLSSWCSRARAGWPTRDGFLSRPMEAPHQVEYSPGGRSSQEKPGSAGLVALDDDERAIVGDLGALGEAVELPEDRPLEGGGVERAALAHGLGKAGVAELLVLPVPGLGDAVGEDDEDVASPQLGRGLLVLHLVEEAEHDPA